MDERSLLMAHLEAKRRHVRSSVDGLSDDDARRAPLPSGWCFLGALQHLALDVERLWFRHVIAGEDVMLTDAAWQVPPGEGVATMLDLYGRECAAADAVIARIDLDAAPRAWPEEWGPCPVRSLREALMHVIVETATHAGHLDAARELVDGRQHLVMP